MRIIITTFFIAISMMVSAQEDIARNMINKTELTIQKSQKEMIAGNTTQAEADLSMAVKYQVKAIEAYKNNDPAKAICYTTKAREHALTILLPLKIPGISSYRLSEDERNLGTQHNCASLEAIPAGLIDSSVLMNPDQLNATYKISLN